MAKVPGYIDKLNYIIRFIVDPCHAPIIVYFELALPPLGKAILSWFSFGMDDVIRGYYRPAKALRGNPTNRRGKRPKPRGPLGKALGKIPGVGDDVGQWIGNRIPGREKLAGRSISQGEKALWRVDDVAQRVLFWWMVADILTDFFFEWTTLIDGSVFCRRQKEGSLYAHGPGGNCGFPFGWLPTNAPIVEWAEGGATWTVNFGTTPSHEWIVVSGIKSTASRFGPVIWQTRLRISDANGVTFHFSDEQTVSPGATAQSVVTATMVGGGTVNSAQRAQFGSMSGEFQDVFMYGGPKNP